MGDIIIYLLECKISKKKYIGQTKSYKIVKGKIYKSSIINRLNEHYGAAKRGRTTPLCKIIRSNNYTNFSITEIMRCDVELADTMECFYINEYNTLYPQGLNVQTHSRTNSSVVYNLKENIEKIEIKSIKEDGVNKKIRVLVKYFNDINKKRFMFNRGDESFEDSYNRAKKFCNLLAPSDKIIEHHSLFSNNNIWWPYKEKIDILNSAKIKKIRLTSYGKNLVAIYITTEDMKSWKEQIKYAFGGKHICKNDAFIIAKNVAEELSSRHKIHYIVDQKLHCSQQAIAFKVGD